MALLAKNNIQFITVGGLAVAANGFVRATVDVDILVQSSKENLEKLVGVLATFGEGYAGELKPEELIQETGSTRICEHFDIDIFTKMKGKTYEDFLPNSKTTTVYGQAIRYLNPQQLIELKKGSYREKDVLDVLAMKRVLAEENQTQKEKAAEKSFFMWVKQCLNQIFGMK